MGGRRFGSVEIKEGILYFRGSQGFTGKCHKQKAYIQRRNRGNNRSDARFQLKGNNFGTTTFTVTTEEGSHSVTCDVDVIFR